MKTDFLHAEMEKLVPCDFKNLEKPTTYRRQHSVMNNKAAILDILPKRRIQLQFIFLSKHKIFHSASISIVIFAFIAFILYHQGFSKVFVITFCILSSIISLFASLGTWITVYLDQNFSNFVDDCDIFQKAEKLHLNL